MSTLDAAEGIEDYRFNNARHANDQKLKSRFEHIFKKYERDFSTVGDEIDLITGEVIINNGHLESMQNEVDTGHLVTSSFVGGTESDDETGTNDETPDLEDDDDDIQDEILELEDEDGDISDLERSLNHLGQEIEDLSQSETSASDTGAINEIIDRRDQLSGLPHPLSTDLAHSGILPNIPHDVLPPTTNATTVPSQVRILQNLPSALKASISAIQPQGGDIDETSLHELEANITSQIAQFLAASGAANAKSTNQGTSRDAAWDYPELPPAKRRRLEPTPSRLSLPSSAALFTRSPTTQRSLWAPARKSKFTEATSSSSEGYTSDDSEEAEIDNVVTPDIRSAVQSEKFAYAANTARRLANKGDSTEPSHTQSVDVRPSLAVLRMELEAAEGSAEQKLSRLKTSTKAADVLAVKIVSELGEGDELNEKQKEFIRTFTAQQQLQEARPGKMFTLAEDETLFKLCHLQKMNFDEIMRYIPNRTEDSLRNRWTYIRRFHIPELAARVEQKQHATRGPASTGTELPLPVRRLKRAHATRRALATRQLFFQIVNGSSDALRPPTHGPLSRTSTLTQAMVPTTQVVEVHESSPSTIDEPSEPATPGSYVFSVKDDRTIRTLRERQRYMFEDIAARFPESVTTDVIADRYWNHIYNKVIPKDRVQEPDKDNQQRKDAGNNPPENAHFEIDLSPEIVTGHQRSTRTEVSTTAAMHNGNAALSLAVNELSLHTQPNHMHVSRLGDDKARDPSCKSCNDAPSTLTGITNAASDMDQHNLEEPYAIEADHTLSAIDHDTRRRAVTPPLQHHSSHIFSPHMPAPTYASPSRWMQSTTPYYVSLPATVSSASAVRSHAISQSASLGNASHGGNNQALPSSIDHARTQPSPRDPTDHPAAPSSQTTFSWVRAPTAVMQCSQRRTSHEYRAADGSDQGSAPQDALDMAVVDSAAIASRNTISKSAPPSQELRPPAQQTPRSQSTERQKPAQGLVRPVTQDPAAYKPAASKPTQSLQQGQDSARSPIKDVLMPSLRGSMQQSQPDLAEVPEATPQTSLIRSFQGEQAPPPPAGQGMFMQQPRQLLTPRFILPKPTATSMSHARPIVPRLLPQQSATGQHEALSSGMSRIMGRQILPRRAASATSVVSTSMTTQLATDTPAPTQAQVAANMEPQTDLPRPMRLQAKRPQIKSRRSIHVKTTAGHSSSRSGVSSQVRPHATLRIASTVRKQSSRASAQDLSNATGPLRKPVISKSACKTLTASYATDSVPMASEQSAEDSQDRDETVQSKPLQPQVEICSDAAIAQPTSQQQSYAPQARRTRDFSKVISDSESSDSDFAAGAIEQEESADENEVAYPEKLKILSGKTIRVKGSTPRPFTPEMNGRSTDASKRNQEKRKSLGAAPSIAATIVPKPVTKPKGAVVSAAQKIRHSLPTSARPPGGKNKRVEQLLTETQAGSHHTKRSQSSTRTEKSDKRRPSSVRRTVSLPNRTASVVRDPALMSSRKCVDALSEDELA